nr:endonuclease/exonuclease/phosphatase family protein [uncultured Flavobacterium sp.]
MKIAQLIFFSIFSLSIMAARAQQKNYVIHTVAFYNIENLYDTINDANTRDDDWVYSSSYYRKKISNIARVLSKIGTGENPNSPTIIGLAEAENRNVLEDLIKDPQIVNKDYGIVHFESPDRRGIDCSFLYQKKYFKPTSYANIPLLIYEKDTKPIKRKIPEDDKEDNNEPDQTTKRIYTRDQILLTGFLDGEEINFIVNHWPSRRGGEAISSLLREKAAALNVKIIDSLQKLNPNAKVITMGDLNDGPFNTSLKKVLKTKANKNDVQLLGMYNPMENIAKKGIGTIAFRDAWDVFDQMILTESLIRADYSTYKYWKAGVYNALFMVQTAGQYKGYGLRNTPTVPGFSDHFPVYIYLIKEKK